MIEEQHPVSLYYRSRTYQVVFLRARTIGETGWVAGGQNHWSCMSWFACVIDRLVVCRWSLCSAHPQVNTTPPSGRKNATLCSTRSPLGFSVGNSRKFYTALDSKTQREVETFELIVLYAVPFSAAHAHDSLRCGPLFSPVLKCIPSPTSLSSTHLVPGISTAGSTSYLD